MDIEIRCNSCSKPLAVLNKSLVPGMDALRLEVAPCGSKSCTNCVDCEDMDLLKEVQAELKELKTKLAAHEAIP